MTLILRTGTWLDSDNGMLNGQRQIESNVTRIARAIKPENCDGIQQVVYYHKGVASQGGVVDRVVMGMFCVSFFCVYMFHHVCKRHFDPHRL